MNDRGKYLFARKAPKRHVLADFGPDCRQRLRKRDHVFVLGALADFTKARMVASLGVSPSGLNMSVRKRTNPHVSPGRWNGERLDAPKQLCQLGTVRPRVGETLSRFSAPYAGTSIGHVPQPSRFSRILGIDNGLNISC
jgi:hypothetical protein